MAQITISSDHKLNTIVQLSGAESGTGSYDGIDTLYVEGVTQEALDTALATYMADLDTYLLEPSRETRKLRISKASANFIDEIYPSFRRELFIALAEEARNSGLTNRAAYIGQMLTWVKTVVSSVLALEDSLDAATTIEEISAINFDSAPFLATDPQITVRGAMAIGD